MTGRSLGNTESETQSGHLQLAANCGGPGSYLESLGAFLRTESHPALWKSGVTRQERHGISRRRPVAWCCWGGCGGGSGEGGDKRTHGRQPGNPALTCGSAAPGWDGGSSKKRSDVRECGGLGHMVVPKITHRL